MSELAELMQEPAGGTNHGRLSTTSPEHGGASAPLDSVSAQAAEFLRSGGWSLVTSGPGARGVGGEWQRRGGTTHRGVLRADEYVDPDLVQALIADEFGFDLEQINSVYSTGGRIPSSRIALRDAIDARLLELANGGANMDLFGRHLRLNGSTVDRALARARAKEGKS
jgi:hypothetical protein